MSRAMSRGRAMRTPNPPVKLVNVRKRDSMLPSGKTQPGTQFEVSSCSQREYLSKTSHSMTRLHIRQTQDKIVVRKLHAQCHVCATFLRTT